MKISDSQREVRTENVSHIMTQGCSYGFTQHKERWGIVKESTSEECFTPIPPTPALSMC
jgi:hypothetical protein